MPDQGYNSNNVDYGSGTDDGWQKLWCELQPG